MSGSFLGAFSYTDVVMFGGIAVIAAYLWSTRTKKNPVIADIKKLHVTPIE
jgi:hypothetical protein